MQIDHLVKYFKQTHIHRKFYKVLFLTLHRRNIIKPLDYEFKKDNPNKL